MNNDILLRELRSTLGDLYGEAMRGDAEARKWLVESFPGHEQFFRAIWPGRSERPVHLTPGDLKLLERAAWNIESRLLIGRLAEMAHEHANNTR